MPLDLAERFIEATAWWLTHSSGSAVRAPKHAERIYKSDHGLAIDFGANTFLVEKALERCRNKVNDYLDEAARGHITEKSDVIETLKRIVSGAVANADGYEYTGYYPVENDDLVFGAQSIDLNDAADFIIWESGIEDLWVDL